jgi:hypothetical protein
VIQVLVVYANQQLIVDLLLQHIDQLSLLLDHPVDIQATLHDIDALSNSIQVVYTIQSGSVLLSSMTSWAFAKHIPSTIQDPENIITQ